MRGERCEMGGGRCEVRGERWEVRSERCEVRGARREVRGERCEVRGARCEVRGEMQAAPARDGERCAAGRLRLAVILSVSAGCCRWKSSRASLHTGVPFHLATPAAVSISAPSANVGSSSKRRESRWEPPEASARPTAGERWRASGRSTLIVPRACDGSSMRPPPPSCWPRPRAPAPRVGLAEGAVER